MVSDFSELGESGEQQATAYLIKCGYKIVDRNVRARIGEIDIVAKDQGVLCFVEVKTRQSQEYGSPLEAVTPAKQRKLAKMAEWYVQEKNLEDMDARFDVVGISVEDEEYIF